MDMTIAPRKKVTDHLSTSYEGLPPNFSLAANMAAGAFAGIAVRTPRPSITTNKR